MRRMRVGMMGTWGIGAEMLEIIVGMWAVRLRIHGMRGIRGIRVGKRGIRRISVRIQGIRKLEWKCWV